MWGWALNEDRIRYKQAAASRHHISYLPLSPVYRTPHSSQPPQSKEAVT